MPHNCFTCDLRFAAGEIAVKCPRTLRYYHCACKVDSKHDEFCDECPEQETAFKVKDDGEMKELHSYFLRSLKSRKDTVTDEQIDHSNYFPTLMEEVAEDYKNFQNLSEKRDHCQRKSSYYNLQQIHYTKLLTAQPSIFKRKIKLHPRRKNQVENDLDIALIRGRFPTQSEAVDIADWIEQYQIEGQLLEILSRVGY